MKPISPTLHGIIDYVMSGVFLALPFAFAFTGGYAYVCYALGAGYLMMALLTNMPFGLFKWVPFRVHGGFELVSALMFIASAGYFTLPRMPWPATYLLAWAWLSCWCMPSPIGRRNGALRPR